MRTADVVVAGGGIAGLLIASELATQLKVVLLEQDENLPRGKYWLSDGESGRVSPAFFPCIDRIYNQIDFVAYDGLKASVSGTYCLWDTDRLIEKLTADFVRSGGDLLTGYRLYSYSQSADSITIRANAEMIKAKLLVDCMGFGSPLVAAKGIASIMGYYILCGCEVRTRDPGIAPVALDNAIVHGKPTYFELFPTSHGTAHAAVIVPARHHKPDRSLKADLNFILQKSHYSDILDGTVQTRSYFGIIPVGRLYRPALDRIIFFGEAGQTNPAASATGLSRMLHIYRALAEAIFESIERSKLTGCELIRAIPQSMTRMNRAFQECVFEDLVSFNSDDFRRLVLDLRATPHDVLNDLIFARFEFGMWRTLPLALRALMRRRSVLGRNVVKSVARALGLG